MKKEIVTTRKMTVSEYAELIGVSKPAICYRMKNKRPLPGVLSTEYDMSEKRFVFDVDVSMTKEKALPFFQTLINYQKHKNLV